MECHQITSLSTLSDASQYLQKLYKESSTSCGCFPVWRITKTNAVQIDVVLKTCQYFLMYCASRSNVHYSVFAEGLRHVRRIILHDCRYLYDDALEYLPLVKNTLQYLQLSNCGDITNRGLVPLTQLR